MHILFLTTANLSANPRLVKEIRFAITYNYKVTVVLFDLKQWTTELEKLYQKEFKYVQLIYLPATRQNLISWLQLNINHFAAQRFYRYFPLSLKLAAVASSKRSFSLVKKLKNLCFNFDLIIAHNLGALYPAYQIAQKLNVPFAFDVEDYHPGEIIQIDTKNEIRRRLFLMQQLLPKAAYVTAASPLIARAVKKLCKVPVVTINNSFNSNEFELPVYDNPDEKLKLVWFSQNINHGRGLELLLPALDSFCDAVTLTLIGNLNYIFANKWLQHRDYIRVVSPLKQDLLHKELSRHDVGLALELSNIDHNKEIALSNKIFAYKQAGLFVLATDTKAQVAFMNHFKGDGYLCEQTSVSLKNGIAYILENITVIRAEKRKRFEQAKEIAFEAEAQKLIALWQQATRK
ncbi:hypothetical protein H7F15_04710 [Pontibacter sp. Tf4]|uniref:hypothetical protein n=1 Tax=Pontibacter sp. Tf4 TaxID=2761620 RepID=UPI00162ABCBB|nr:hypothetical protein [Pontibacter sp. Tf4]MBB6610330.1 hypothetical protein [Pontibacter sp. Tf4]